MSNNKQLSLRELIGNFYEKHKHLGKPFTVNHFKLEDVHRSLVYRVIGKIENGLSLNRKVGSGSYKRVPQKVKNKIIEENVLEVGKSERLIGRKWGIDGKTVKKIMIEAGVNKTKRRKAPKSSEEQKVRQKKRLIKVSKSFFMP